MRFFSTWSLHLLVFIKSRQQLVYERVSQLCDTCFFIEFLHLSVTASAGNNDGHSTKSPPLVWMNGLWGGGWDHPVRRSRAKQKLSSDTWEPACHQHLASIPIHSINTKCAVSVLLPPSGENSSKVKSCRQRSSTSPNAYKYPAPSSTSTQYRSTHYKPAQLSRNSRSRWS